MNKQENLDKMIVKYAHSSKMEINSLPKKSVFNLNHTRKPIKVKVLIFSGIKISIFLFKLRPVSDHNHLSRS